MCLQLLRAPLPQDSRITPCLRIIQHHGLIEEVKPIDFVNGIRSRVDVLKDNKRLPLGF